MQTFKDFLVESLEPIPTNNEGGGYHGNVKSKNEADAAEKYKARFKDVANHVKHIPGVTAQHIRNYLDSPEGRHAAETTSHADHIAKHYARSGKVGFEKSFREIQRQTKNGHFDD